MSKIVSQEDESAEKAFYADLDKKTTRRSCCTWQTFVIFFCCLAIVASTVTVYLFYKIKQAGFSIEKLYPSTVSKESFLAKLKIGKENPTFSITITQQELTSVMANGLKTISFEIKETQTIIDSSGVTFYGKLIKPLKADIKIETVPKIKDGKIFFEVAQTSAGKLVLPRFLNSEIEKALNNLMDENFATLYENYNVEKIELQKDQMEVSGRLK